MHLKEYFNRMAAEWEVRPEVIDRLREIVSWCKVQGGARVLDVACGTGVLTPILLEAVGEGGKVVGIDFAPEMIKQARAHNLSQNASFLVADVINMPFADESFDWVFCNGAIPHFSDLPGSLCEMRRVLRAGGSLIICHASSRAEINERHRSIGEPVADNQLPAANELRITLETAGFDKLHCEDAADRFVFVGRKLVSGGNGQSTESPA